MSDSEMLPPEDDDSAAAKAIRKAHARSLQPRISEVESWPVFSPTFISWVIGLVGGLLAPLIGPRLLFPALQEAVQLGIDGGEGYLPAAGLLVGSFAVWAMLLGVLIIYLAKARNLASACAFAVFLAGPPFIWFILPSLLRQMEALFAG